MPTRKSTINRRQCLKAMAAGAVAGLPLAGSAGQVRLPAPPKDTAPSVVARDEAFWAEVAKNYDRTKGIVNLEHGYWGKMAHPVQDAYIDATRMVNAQNSFYARKDYPADEKESVRRVARALGVHDDEIALTRNATESIHNLIRQYRGLTADHAVLYADVDYPHFKTAMRWLEGARGVRPVELVIPSRANQAQIFDLYRDAFDKNPDLKLMLLMHVSNQHGLAIPVARIAEAESMSHIEFLGGLDEESWTGMGSFRLAGRATPEEVTALQQRLEKEFGIFTVVRKGLASGYCARITPQVFTTPDELALLVDALKRLA